MNTQPESGAPDPSPRTDSPGLAAPDAALLDGGGEMGARIRAMDWSQTALGPIETWPQSLRTAIRILLTSRFAMWMGWGKELTFFCNDAYLPTVGVKQSWVLGAPAERVWAEVWSAAGPRAQAVLQTGVATWDEGLLLFLERSGYPEETYHTFSYSPLPDDHGGIGGMLCVVTEETERTLGERRLALLRELAADLSSANTEHAIRGALERSLSDKARARDLPFTLTYLFTEDGRRARCACATGVEPGSALAPPWLELGEDSGPWPAHEVLAQGRHVLVSDLSRRFAELPLGPWDRPARQALVVPLAQQGQGRPAGFLVAGLNPYRPLDAAYGGFIELLAGQLAACFANAHAYEQERRRAEALAELDRAKTVFFSNVSHEFRTPLTLLLAPIEDALVDGSQPLPPAQRERLLIVQRNSQRLLKLVNTLLDFSRIEAGRLQAEYRPTALGPLTTELASNFRAACERAGLELHVDCPDLDEPVYVDRDLWEKIVLNLLSNAFKYTLEGAIRLTLRRDGDCAELAVQDTGIGIPESELPHLFERFHRVESARGRSLEGTGIGLALVSELVQLHGGTIRVRSQEGAGSTFTVRLPLGHTHLAAGRVRDDSGPAPAGDRAAPLLSEALRWLPSTTADPADPPRRESEPSAIAPVKVSARPRVLLADDNADMREYVQRLLAPEHEVIAVADGQQALRAARERSPDLVLSDVMMPNLDGFGLLRELRADPRTAATPIILLSARAGEEARVEGRKAGADDYLTKPFSARELLVRVHSALALSKLRREIARREEELQGEKTTVLESIKEAFAAVDASWRFTYVNAQAERIYRMRREELLGRVLWEVFPEIVGTIFERAHRRTMSERAPVRMEEYYKPNARWFEVSIYPLKDGGVASYFRDITGRKRTESLVAGQKKALELELHGAELEEVLGVLTQTVEAQSGGCCLASILLLDPDGVHLRHGAAPGLPAAYNRAIDGLAIGPAVGTCGTAAYTQQTVVVSDTEVDPLWDRFRELAREHGLRAAWSTPIFSSQGKVLGTFAIYYREVRSPSASDRELVGVLAPTAALIIERRQEVRERLAAVQAVRESEQRYRQLVHSLPAAVYTCDAEGRLTLYNDAARILWGRSPVLHKERWCGAARMLALDETPIAPAEGPMAVVLREGRAPPATEAIVERPDGSRRYVLMHPQPIRDSAGQLTGALNIVVDITERKRVEYELFALKDDLFKEVQSLTRLHALAMQLVGTLELRPALQAVLDASIEIQGADLGLLSLYSEDAGVLRPTISRGFSQAVLSLLAELRPGPGSGACGSAFAARTRTVVADAESDERFASCRDLPSLAGFRAVHSTPIFTRAGELLGVLSVHYRDRRVPTRREMQFADLCARHAADVIETVRSQQVLRESEQRFRLMADSASMMVWVTDTDGRCSFRSRSWHVFTGQRLEQGLASGWLDAVHPEQRSRVREVYATAHQRQEPFLLEYRVRQRDGQYRWALDTAAPRFTEQGRYVGHIGSLIDITERRNAEDALKEADRRKDEFLATLAHELRNPLAPMRSGLQLLRMAGGADAPTERIHGMMERQVNHLVRLVDDLLEISRITRGKIDLRTEEVDVAAVVRNAVETSRPLIEAAEHQLEVALPSEPLHVRADPVRLSQVIANLLNNAAKYTPRKGRICLGVTAQDAEVRIAVRDNGVGIPADMLPRVFELFTQVDRTQKQSQGGLGIGLALVKSLVEMHHGRIEAHSEGPDRGSEFVVCLPRLDTRAHGSAAHVPGAQPGAPLRRLSILIIDDSRDAAESLSLLLDHLGSEVRTAHDGPSGLRTLESFRPDVILLDIGMPGMDGYEVARRIRQQPELRDVILIALTGWGQEEDRLRAKTAGFDHHLVKPVELPVLQALLASIRASVPVLAREGAGADAKDGP